MNGECILTVNLSSGAAPRLALALVALTGVGCYYDGNSDDWRAEAHEVAPSRTSSGGSTSSSSTGNETNPPTCNAFSYGNEGCDNCAHAKCCADIDACIKDTDCLAYLQCLKERGCATSTSGACQTSCHKIGNPSADIPSNTTYFYPIDTCLENSCADQGFAKDSSSSSIQCNGTYGEVKK